MPNSLCSRLVIRHGYHQRRTVLTSVCPVRAGAAFRDGVLIERRELAAA